VVLEKLIGQFLFDKAASGPPAPVSDNAVPAPGAAKPAAAASVAGSATK